MQLVNQAILVMVSSGNAGIRNEIVKNENPSKIIE